MGARQRSRHSNPRPVCAGILDGDLLAIHRTEEVRSSQIIIARLEGGMTVKRLKRRGGRIELNAQNPDDVCGTKKRLPGHCNNSLPMTS